MSEKATTFVDVLVRVKVTHPVGTDPMELTNESELSFYHSDDTVDIDQHELLEVVNVGAMNEEGTLVREDGGTGRNAVIAHDPPLA